MWLSLRCLILALCKYIIMQVYIYNNNGLVQLYIIKEKNLRLLAWELRCNRDRDLGTGRPSERENLPKTGSREAR